MTKSARLALIGDVHSRWSGIDTEYFNHSDYDALLFTGDLPRIVGGIPDARALSGLTKPAIVVPGNHDGATVSQFLGELKNWPGLCRQGASGQVARMQAYRDALGPVQLGGYSLHPLELSGRRIDCLVGRPHSMGGNRLYFAPYIEEQFGVRSLAESTALLKQLVDQAGDELIFLGHNGPAGLGDRPHSPWGIDFRPEGGDFGDTDWRVAIDYALIRGKRVWAVVGGHMHHHVKHSKRHRQWLCEQNGVYYINAARVPRIFRREDRIWHHHVALTLSDQGVECLEIHVEAGSGEERVIQPLLCE